MQVNQILDQGTCSDLGRNKPASATVAVSAKIHNRMFYFFSNKDMWTEDGWLITAVQDDGVTHHVRKGNQRARIVLTPETNLFHTPLTKEKKQEFDAYMESYKKYNA